MNTNETPTEKYDATYRLIAICQGWLNLMICIVTFGMVWYSPNLEPVWRMAVCVGYGTWFIIVVAILIAMYRTQKR